MAKNKSYLNDEEIIDMYLNGASSTEIGKKYGVTHRTILLRLKKNNISRRTLSESQWNYNKKDLPNDFYNYDAMYQKYIVERKSKKELGEFYGCDPCVIDRVLKTLGIKKRTNSESKVGLYVGEKAFNWKGGITTLNQRIREYLTDQHIQTKVLKRDNYTCVKCGTHKNLHVHHIVPFKNIMENILSENPKLSVTDNKEELYKIAVQDSRINDTNNLITVCADCHHKLHNWNVGGH